MTMFHRFRLLAAGLALISSFGVVYVGASAATSARISAHLTSKSFTAAQAGSVQVVYKFSSKSTRFAYVLSRKTGSAWSTVRSASRRGSFRGSHTMTVKSVFGSKPITAGQYRLKLSSSANSVTLSFTVVPSPAVKPSAGLWYGTILSGPVSSGPGVPSVTVTSVGFTVEPDQATVSHFTFRFKVLRDSWTADIQLLGIRQRGDKRWTAVADHQGTLLSAHGDGPLEARRHWVGDIRRDLRHPAPRPRHRAVFDRLRWFRVRHDPWGEDWDVLVVGWRVTRRPRPLGSPSRK